MNAYRNPARPLSGERGMALISALLLLLVISLLAVGLSMDSSMDIRAAAYQKFRARAFAAAESGMIAASDILESNIEAAGWNTTIPFEFPELSDEYLGSINVVDNGVFYIEENPDENRTLEMTGEIPADVVIQKGKTLLAKGGAIQVAAGYAGMGKGLGGGGANMIYNICATGSDADKAKTSVAMSYRVVTK